VRRGLLVALGLSALLATAGQRALAAERWRIAVSETNGPPFVLYASGGRFDGGLAADLMTGLGEALGLEGVFLNVPRGRVEPGVRDGDLDAACFLAPDWVVDSSRLRWSPELFRIQQVIVSRAGGEHIASAEQLHGKRVGTLLNYRYPELQPLFAEGRIERVDAPNTAANIAKLRAGRIDAFLDVDLSILYAIESGKLPENIQVDLLWAPDNPVHCAFSPAFAEAHPAFHQALQQMVDDGRIDAWIRRYTGGRRAGMLVVRKPQMASAASAAGPRPAGP